MRRSTFHELLDRLRHGDEQAAEELVRQYEPEIRRMVRMRLNGSLSAVVDSVDISQSVFANFFVRVAIGQFDLDSPEQLLNLLIVMARNKCVDWQRREGKQRMQRAMLQEEPADDAESPFDRAEWSELMERFRSRLSTDEQDLAARRARGEAWNDIAQELGTTPDACRKRLTRACDRVAQELGLE